MTPFDGLQWRRPAWEATLVLGALAGSTLLVALLHGWLGVPDASAAYLLGVVAVAVAAGTRAAIATAVGAFLATNFVFTEPRFTITVSDPGDWLELVLLLVVGVVVGRLAGLQRSRADAAEAREREARALFGVSQQLATAASFDDAAAEIARIVARDAGMERAWIRVEDEGAAGAVVADTDARSPLPSTAVAAVLQRKPGSTPAEWMRVHEAGRNGTAAGSGSGSGGGRHVAYRVRMTAEDRVIGSLWAIRSRSAPRPDRSQTRLLGSAADQLAGALVRQRLAALATEAEVARRSEAAKSALLDSVSHDLRTPLASIRTAAGSLMDPAVAWGPEEMRATAGAIDREAERLNRLVSNLLDMSRIEAGVVTPHLATHVLADLVERTADRLAATLTDRHLALEVPPDLPPVRVDDVWVDQVLTNLLENAARYTPPDASITVSARPEAGTVRLTVADDGPGVPPAALARLFEKFYRVPRTGEGARRGSGIGLSVVRGLIEAMGGRITARSAMPHGLAIDLWLPIAARPAFPAPDDATDAR